MRTALPLAAGAALALACPTFAGLHKCVDADGEVTYRQTACPGSAAAIMQRTGSPPQNVSFAVKGHVARPPIQRQGSMPGVA
jgi:hypothetical protein